jgi:hypothetical protein
MNKITLSADERLSIASLFGTNLKEGQKLVERKEDKWL